MVRQVTVGLILIMVAYGLLEAWPLIRGPVLVITEPIDHSAPASNTLTISGSVKRTAVLTLNSSPLLYDQNGSFSSTLTFPSGGSILTFVATDRFGRSVTRRQTIFIP